MLQKAASIITVLLSFHAWAEISPAETKVLWNELKASHGEQLLEEYFSPEVTSAIEWYTQHNPDDLSDPRSETEATPAAFAVGFAVAFAAKTAESGVGGLAYTDINYDIYEAGDRPYEIAPAMATAAAAAAGGAIGEKIGGYIVEKLRGAWEKTSSLSPMNEKEFDL